MARCCGLFVLLLFLVACAPAPPASVPAAPAPPDRETPRPTPRLNVIVNNLINNPTPQASTSNAWLYWPVWDSLVQFGPDYQVRPSVAERWQLSADSLTWTFTLRRDLTWPDGTPLTAADAAFTVSYIQQNNWPQRSVLLSVERAEAPDPATLVLTTRQPDMSILNNLPTIWLLPQHYLEQVGFQGYVAKPMGSGPYEIVEFRPGDSLLLRKRPTPHAFRTVFIEELAFKVVTENSQKIRGLQTGEYGLMVQPNLTAEQVEQVKQLGFTVLSFPTAMYGIVIPQGPNQARNTPLTDKRVRLALNYAVDWEAISKNLFGGRNVPAGQFAVPGSLMWDPDLKPIPYDPARARQLLAEAGYPNGFKLPYGMDSSTAQAVSDIVLAVQGYLRAIGVEFEIHQVEFGLIADKALGRNNQILGDLYAFGSGDANGFWTFNRTYFGCGRPLGGGPNSFYYCNPEFDRLYEAALAEPDPTRRAQLMRQANRVFREDYPMIFGTINSVLIVHRPEVKGLTIVNGSIFNFDSAYKA
jgi:peptide/nickel transport system substrate-binding protein